MDMRKLDIIFAQERTINVVLEQVWEDFPELLQAIVLRGNVHTSDTVHWYSQYWHEGE